MLRPPLAHSAVTIRAAIWNANKLSTMLAYGEETHVYYSCIVDMLCIERSQSMEASAESPCRIIQLASS